MPGAGERGAVERSVSGVKERSLVIELVWQRSSVKRGLVAGALAMLGWAVAR